MLGLMGRTPLKIHTMNQSEDQDPAWDLLNQAREIDISPTFTQDVLRDVRRLEPKRGDGAWGWLSLRWGAALAGAVALLIGGIFVVTSADQSASDPEPHAVAGGVIPEHEKEISIEDFTEELEELAYMSDRLNVADPSLLPDEDLAALLF
jgi:hypothetical protein